MIVFVTKKQLLSQSFYGLCCVCPVILVFKIYYFHNRDLFHVEKSNPKRIHLQEKRHDFV